jgi:hypothetical protein
LLNRYEADVLSLEFNVKVNSRLRDKRFLILSDFDYEHEHLPSPSLRRGKRAKTAVKQEHANQV